MKKKKILAITIPIGILLILITSCLIYMLTYYKAKDVSKYLESDEFVTVTKNKDYYFFDGAGTKDCLIFYPGAKVDETAYSKLMNSLAKNGVDCYLMKMPFHMAIFDVDAANNVLKENNYENYYLSGHSMGGAMAARYVIDSKYDIDGLIFLAAYTDKEIDEKIDVLSIYGSNDGVLGLSKVIKGRSLVKGDYKEIVIEGANHANFASYGNQKKDKEATISKDEQINLTLGYILEFING